MVVKGASYNWMPKRMKGEVTDTFPVAVVEAMVTLSILQPTFGSCGKLLTTAKAMLISC
jgi:hypothetical protein